MWETPGVLQSYNGSSREDHEVVMGGFLLLRHKNRKGIVSIEFIHIRHLPDGSVSYTAYPI